jgi:hypothetical protein
MGFSSIELEGDAREIILALGNPTEAASIYGNLVLKTRQILVIFIKKSLSLSPSRVLFSFHPPPFFPNQNQ